MAAALAAYVAYDLYNRGPNPEKRVELTTLSPINLLSGLSALKDKATMSVTVEGETYDNIVIAQAYFVNAGTAPIVPAEYHEKLSVSVDSPWKIVAVENGTSFGKKVMLEWRRISDTRFEAKPALVNPRDKFDVSVYLTNTEFSAPYPADEAPDPAVDWSARVTNLPEFSSTGDILERLQQEYSAFPPIRVHLSGWAVVFTIAVALVLQVTYLHLLARSGLVREWRLSSIGLVALTSLLSFVAAECLATYLFRNVMTYYGVDHWMNAPPLIINAALLAFLWWKVATRSEKSPA